MTPTSEERREVAERLKEYATGFDFGDSNPWWYVQKAVFGDVIAHDTSDAFALLADLIDPTCEMVVKNGHACCGRCGHRLADECEVEEDYYEFRPFCPDCGARVTNGGER